MGQEDAEVKSVVIQRRLLELCEFHEAKTIAFYVAKESDNEVHTKDAIKNALENGRRVLVPVTDVVHKNLIFSEIRNFGELASGTFGVLEPREEYRRYVNVGDIGLVIVPAIAFDRKGNRIGHGQGYYDRFLIVLGKRVVKIGLAYDFQIVDAIPTSYLDVKVDKIVTERQVVICQ